jgi:hypothetical protein
MRGSFRRTSRLRRRDLKVWPGDEIVLFFDGSKSDDATGLVGCRAL